MTNERTRRKATNSRMPQLMEYRFLFLPIALGLLLPSLTLPWVVINFLGHHSFSPMDVAITLNYQNTVSISNQPQNRFDIINLASAYADSYFVFILSLFLYLLSIASMLVSIAWKTHRSRIALVAGILAITAGMAWIYSIESLKAHYIQSAASTGGLIGEEWKGNEGIIINSIIVLGFGHYIVMLAGVLPIFSYVIEKAFGKPEQDRTAGDLQGGDS